MNAFAPDFSHYWLFGQGERSGVSATRAAEDEPLPPSIQEALDALAERITAARSIV